MKTENLAPTDTSRFEFFINVIREKEEKEKREEMYLIEEMKAVSEGKGFRIEISEGVTNSILNE